MANALQTLFSDIATSIRGGLPDAGKMSPYSFPEKIDEIVESGSMPEATPEGQLLQAVNGEWVAVEIADGNNMTF